MMHRGITLQTAQHRHTHAARRTHPAQIIAQQIDDHHILGPVFAA